MCTVTLQPVNELCGANVPGNRTLYVINDDEVLDYPARTADSATLSGDITTIDDPASPGTPVSFNRFTFREETCQHTETQNASGGVDGSIVCRFDKDDDVKRHLFGQMPNGRYTILITDENGLTKARQKCRFTRNFDSGTAGEDINSYEVTFTYVGQEADIYTGVVA